MKIWTIISAAGLIFLGVGCGPQESQEGPTAAQNVDLQTGEKSAVISVRPHFVDVVATSGLDFENVSGSPAQGYIFETLSAGAAFLDYDGDGYQDIFVVDGTRLQNPPAAAGNRLYRNRGVAPGARFEEVSAAAGIEHSGWGMGCAVGDYDNDGNPDLYVTYWGANRLYHNEGDGSFVEVAAGAGVADSGWGTSAAFADVDMDGLLDLYVVNYLEFDMADPPAGNLGCRYKGLESFCGPEGIPAQADRLYRNGGGVFTDMTEKTGMGRRALPGLGVVFGDYDNDGDPDLYVANDSEPNLFYRNEGNWRFAEIATEAGLAYSENGRAQAGMGVHAGDYDNDGDLDLFVTNFSDDVNTLYQNQGGGKGQTGAAELRFVDATYSGGLGGVVQPYLGWSAGFFDYDNDGWLDLFVANGHIYPQLDQLPDGLRYAQRNLLYRNERGRYVEIGRQAGPGWQIEKVSRAAAVADYDNDGDPDLLVMNLNDGPNLLRNEGGNLNNWLGLELVGTRSNRDAIGARVQVWAGGSAQLREIQRGYGFQSQHDRRLLFGLGQESAVDSVVILWPSGQSQVVEQLLSRRYHRIREGDEEVQASVAVPQPKELAAPTGLSSAKERPAKSAVAAGSGGWKAADYRQAGKKYFRQGRYAEARAALEEALAREPGVASTYVNLGLVLHSGIGDFAEAAAVLERAVQIDPKRGDAHYLLGKVYLGQDRVGEALDALKIATRLSPKLWEYDNWLGLAYMRSDSLAAAEVVFQGASKKAPWEPRPYLHLARLYDEQGRSREAEQARLIFARLDPIQEKVEHYQGKVEDYPDNPRARSLLGMTYFEQGRLQEAHDSFKQAVLLDSLYAPAIHGLGRILQLENQLPKAIWAYERAIQLDPNLFEVHSDLGQAHHQSKRYDLAIAAYQRALQLQPKSALIYTNLGMAYAMQQRYEEAVRAFKTGIEQEPNVADPRNALAQVYVRQRRFAAAIEQWEEVLRLVPNHPRVAEWIQQARGRLGK